MNVTLWVLQGVLGVAFAGAGLMKLALDKTVLAEKGMDFVDEVSAGFVKGWGPPSSSAPLAWFYRRLCTLRPSWSQWRLPALRS